MMLRYLSAIAGVADNSQRLLAMIPSSQQRFLSFLAQVSRRVRSADYVRKLADEGKLARHATRYMPASIVEEVYLHPRSCLASVAPEYVVYGDIIRTAKRPYMALVTAIEPHWLADCGSSLCKGEWLS